MSLPEIYIAYTTKKMANLIIKDTGVDHLYPDGVPIVELEIVISDILKLTARMSS